MTDDIYLDEIIALRARLKRIEEAAGVAAGPPTFTTDQIADPAFWRDHKREIMKAAAEGRIVESEPVEPVRVEYPETGIPGLIQRGPGMYEATPPAKETK
jgi:hypothetical protein